MSEAQTALVSTTNVGTKGTNRATVSKNQRSSQATKDLVGAVKAFIANPSFQSTSDLADENDQLRKQLREKDDQLQRWRAANEGCLMVFREDSARRDEDIAQRDGRIRALESAIGDHKKQVEALHSIEQQLLAQHRETTDLLNTERSNNVAVQRRISELEITIVNQRGQVKNLRERLEAAEVSRKNAESSYKAQRDMGTESRRMLKETEDELNALKGLGYGLKEEGMDQTYAPRELVYLFRVLTRIQCCSAS